MKKSKSTQATCTSNHFLLPDPLLLLCLSFVVDTLPQWRKLCLVSKLFLRCASKSLTAASPRNLQDLSHVCNFLVHLRELHLPPFKQSDGGVGGKWFTEKILNISEPTSVLTLEPISQLTNLYKLEASFIDFPADQFHWLLPLRSLRKLTMSSNPALRDEHLLLIVKHFPELKTLRLGYCDNFTTTGYRALPLLTHLRRLDVCGNKGLTSSDVRGFSVLTSLTVLDIAENSHLTDEGLMDLYTLTNLQELCLGHNTGLTDRALLGVTGMTSLQRLFLDGVHDITGAGLSLLTQLSHLRTVNLYFDGEIGDEEVSILAPMNSLRILQLSNHVLKGTSLPLFTQITSLVLHDCAGLTNKSIATMAKALPQLTLLKLSGSLKRVTNETVLSLIPLTNLEELYLNVWYNITDDAIIKLCQHLTKLYAIDLEACGELTVGVLAGFAHLPLKQLTVSFTKADFGRWSAKTGMTGTTAKFVPAHLTVSRVVRNTSDAVIQALAVLPASLTFLRLGEDTVNQNSQIACVSAALPNLKFLKFGHNARIDLANFDLTNFAKGTLVPIKKQDIAAYETGESKHRNRPASRETDPGATAALKSVSVPTNSSAELSQENAPLHIHTPREGSAPTTLAKGARRQRNKKVNLLSQWALESKKPK